MAVNKKMQKLFDKLEEKTRGEKIEIELNSLDKLFFPEFKKVYDCIIISSEKVEELEAEFEQALKFLGGKNFYEISNTEILINSYLQTQNYTLYTVLKLTMLTIEMWKNQLKLLEPKGQFCFIISCDANRVTLRFHKVREGQPEWLNNDLEIYNQPIGYLVY